MIVFELPDEYLINSIIFVEDLNRNRIARYKIKTDLGMSNGFHCYRCEQIEDEETGGD